MRPVFVIAEGGKTRGMGHIVRQFALCQLLNIQNKVTVFIQSDWTNREAKTKNFFFKTFHLIADISEALDQIPVGALVMMDGYSFDINRINQIKKNKDWQIIFVADAHKEVPDCDVLINHLPWITNSDYPKAIISKKLLGPAYAILREPFYSGKKIADEKRALICLGGSDIEPQIDKIYASLMENNFSSDKIDVLHNKSMPSSSIKHLHCNVNAEQVYALISKAHVCFITPGNISYEVFSINRGVVMGYVSENQKEVVEKFEKMHLCYNVGEWNLADFKNMPLWIKEAEDTKIYQAPFFNNLNLFNIKNELSLYVD